MESNSFRNMILNRRTALRTQTNSNSFDSFPTKLNITFDDGFINLTPYLYLKQEVAAKSLNCSLYQLRKKWKEVSCGKKWPARKLQVLKQRIQILRKNASTVTSCQSPSSIPMPFTLCKLKKTAAITNLITKWNEECPVVFLKL